MSINQLLSEELFKVYENIDIRLNKIQKGNEDFETKKKYVKELKEQYTGKLNKYKEAIGYFSEYFIKKNQLNNHIISARVGSPTPYGYQPKNYLWSGISIDEDKSFSFQYSWVIQKDLIEVTFCFGSGVSTSGKLEINKKESKENNLKILEQNLFDAISKPENMYIVRKLIENEGFVITSNWLQKDKTGSGKIEDLMENLRNNSAAKSGITRFFSKDEVLAEGFDLEEKIFNYFKIFKPIWDSLEGNPHEQLQRQGIKKIKSHEEKHHRNIVYQLKDIVTHINNYITTKGFYYKYNEIVNLLLSLKTKPFVIMSGISGTGKTKIIHLFAESLGATSDNGQFALIPVRPDWSDGSDLIGYRDIKGEFQAGPFTKVLIEANKPENRDKPFFVLLDEMNLARVEYYFSDLLSVMESRDRKDGELVSAPVVEETEVGRLLMRDNLFIIGTVNMDETTHPFSPKVLDRANTIEYNEVFLDNFGFLSKDSAAEPLSVSNKQVAGRFLNLKDAYFDHEGLVKKVTSLLVEVNSILEPIKAHFGYRVRDEVCFYMIYNDEGQLMSFDEAFDYQLLQKVLPRLTGNDLKTEVALKKLFRFCTRHEWVDEDVEATVKEARFPKSARKLSNMIPKIMHDGFTSFWGS
jgi:AAA domain (dynein-related subfamily)